MEIKINEEQSVIIDERDEKSKSKANSTGFDYYWKTNR